MARLLLIALFLISAAPPKKADYQRRMMIHNEPLQDWTHLIAEDAPVSDLT